MNKIESYILKRIFKEIKSGVIKGVHGITKENIKEHLVKPKLERYRGSAKEEDIFMVWTILEEKAGEGYTIFYDPEANCFGLGMHGTKGELIHLSEVGSFLDTLNGM